MKRELTGKVLVVVLLVFTLVGIIDYVEACPPNVTKSYTPYSDKLAEDKKLAKEIAKELNKLPKDRK